MPYSIIISVMITVLMIAGAPTTASARLDLEIIPYLWTIKLLMSCFVVFFISRFMSERIFKTRLPDLFEWACLFLIFIDLYVLNIKAVLLETNIAALQHSRFVELVLIALYIIYLLCIWTSFFLALATSGVITKKDIRHEILTKLKFLFPAIIPYTFVNILTEFIDLLEMPFLRHIQEVLPQSISFLLAVLVLIILIPFFIKKIWGCKPLSQGMLRNAIESITKQADINFRDILVWPLAGSRACTAAVVGLFPGARYLMLTDCLLQALTLPEIEAVVAHEVAHVKKMHLWCQFALLAGYAMLIYSLAEPAMQWLFSHKIVIKLMLNLEDVPFALTSFMLILPFILFFILYFRFFMGYFIRHCEREADMAIFDIHNHPYNLISSLEKIAFLAGGIRNQPSWHHFSIAERVAFLQQCHILPEKRTAFTSSFLHKKIIAIGSICTLLVASHVLPLDKWGKERTKQTLDNTIATIMEEGGDNPLWFLLVGQLLTEKGLFEQALTAYQKAFALAPESPEVLNDYAWFLITNPKQELKKQEIGLQYALKAANIKRLPHILDTLAEAYFVNGMFDEAIETEKQAINMKPENIEHYKKQLLKFEAELLKKNKGSFAQTEELKG